MTVGELKNIIKPLNDDAEICVYYENVMQSYEVEKFLEIYACFSMAKQKYQLGIEILKK